MKRILTILLLLGSGALGATGFHGWYDKSGRLHISNVPPKYLNEDGTVRPEWYYRHFADPEFLARQRQKEMAETRQRIEAPRATQRDTAEARQDLRGASQLAEDDALAAELAELQTRLRREESLLFVMEADQRLEVPRYYPEDVTEQRRIVAALRAEVAALEKRVFGTR